MKERPIIFNGEMVRTIIDGRKTQTRRTINGGDYTPWQPCPFGQPGDHLWVRETWAEHDEVEVVYRNPPNWSPLDVPPVDKWRPSIHMPHWASRITLEITSVRLERVQDISEEDAKAEGVFEPCGWANPTPARPYRLAFSSLWESIYSKRAPWSSNPWVWVIEFMKVSA